MKKKLFFLMTFFLLIKLDAQTWQNIGGNENYNGYHNASGSGYSGYYETIGEYSPHNLPYFYGNGATYGSVLATLNWNVNDNLIYLYEVKDEDVHFWVFNVEIKQWKKLNVNSTTSYGTKGVESATNFPGKRTGSLTWVDNNGNLWLYGNNYWPKQTDLWKYNPQTNMWTWISGTQNDSSFLPQQNTATNNGLPKTYTNSYTWVDAQNNLWFFGGERGITDLSSINQVWKYDTSTNQWTWKKGNNDSDYNYSSPIYGNANIENSTNSPGEYFMYKGASWISGNFAYFFPADGLPVLWRYNMQTNNWCHVKKPSDDSMFSYGVQATENPSNFPPSLNNPYFWKDYEGNFWMFGGFVSDPQSHSTFVGKKAYLNTMWKYNVANNNWTWMKGKKPTDYSQNVNSVYPEPYSPGYYGIKGVEASENLPHSRYKGIFWKNANDLFLAYGEGLDNISTYHRSYFKDIWSYNTSSNNFTWVGGRSSSAGEFFENKAEPSVYNKPNVINFINDEEGNVFAFHRYNKNEIWKYNIATQTWVVDKAANTINYGTIGIEDSNNAPPNAKNLWYKDHYIYFTSDNSPSYASSEVSLWKFNTLTKNFTCIKKLPNSFISDINIENINNFPNPAYESVNWVNDEKLYMLGGGNSFYFWEYDLTTNIWKRLTGLPNNQIIEFPAFSKDSQKNVWVFGGKKGSDNSTSTMQYNNNVWKFDYLTKTWMEFQGDLSNSVGYYGTQNISTNQTRPGARYPYASWMDQYDRFWMYSGRGYGENAEGDYYKRSLLDLWYYDTKLNAWFWVDGYKNSFYPHEKELNYYDNNNLVYNYFWKYDNNMYSFVNNEKLYFIGQANDDYNTSTTQFWKLDVSDILPKYSFIEGFSKLNTGSDCSETSIPFTRIKLKATNTDGFTTQSIANSNGYYRIILNNTPSTTLTPVLENPEYFSVTPSSVNVDFQNGNSFNQNFCIVPNGTHNDLEVQFAPVSQARPGFDATYRFIFLNKGNTTLSGNVNLDYQGSKMSFVNSELPVDVQLNSNLLWYFTDLKPFEQKSFLVTFKINPPTHPTHPINAGDKLFFWSRILPILHDETPLDNLMILCDTVVNSLDPNDKTCLEGDVITQEMVGSDIHYLIRFENMGTANAINVVVKDMIDTEKFDIESLQPIKSSHPYRMTITEGNKVEFFFENIQLPFDDANNDGYILFKIKTKPTLVVGNTFSNKADIYFDYNFPVGTNNFITTIENQLNTNETDIKNDISVYPNPAKDMIHFKSKERVRKIEIYDASGRLIKVESGIEDNQANINYLKAGNYVMKIITDKTSYKSKLIKN